MFATRLPPPGRSALEAAVLSGMRSQRVPVDVGAVDAALGTAVMELAPRRKDPESAEEGERAATELQVPLEDSDRALRQADHAEEWQHAGVTAVDDLVSLSSPHHAAKSAELWSEEVRANGSVDWKDPWSNVLVDPPPNLSDPAPQDLWPDELCPF